MYHSLAKTELHCHLDGSLSLAAIRQLADLAGIALPDTDEELKACVTAPAHCESLVDYLTTFDFVRPLLQTSAALELAAYDVAQQAAQENVIYIEIRFAPQLSMDQGLSATQVVEAVCRGLERAQADFGIVAKALICGLRQMPNDLNQAIFTELAPQLGKQVVGGDFAGNEHDFPPATLQPAIQHAQALGYPMTFHAGECGCPHHIAQALALGIKRLGHTTALAHDPQLIADFVAAQATAELCLTSNLQTKAAPTLADFPYLALKKAGANITINTDNRTVSDTNLTKEYAALAQHFGTTPADFYQHNQSAIAASFAHPDEKAQLQAKLKAAYAPHLSN